MIITESLANGLKNRFFTEISEEIDKRFKNLFQQTRGVKNSRTGWAKLAEKFQKGFDRCSIASYQGGSKRKPYFGICSLAIEKNKPYNSWNEKCLFSYPMIASFEPRFAEPSIGLFNISEHAISRLYQRGNIKVVNETEVDIFSIIPEFSLVPVWAMFWARMIAELIADGIEDVRPVIPSRSGLFLAEISFNKIPTIEIRTFVDDSHLTQLQKEVKELFVHASDGIQSSPLVFFPANEYFGVDDTSIQLNMMAFRLVEQSNKIGKVFFHHIEDVEKKKFFIQKLSTLLEGFSSIITMEMSDAYKGDGVRIFHSGLLKLDREDAFNQKS
jgi:hypothetical protein